jgi:type II secretory pathway pseudopilin PulG
MLNIRLPGFHKQSILHEGKGFTLIEVLIACALSAAIVAGLIVVIATSTKIMIRTKNEETAKDIAASEIEYIRSVPYADSYLLPPLSSPYSNFTVTSPVVTKYIEMNEQQIEIDVFVNGNSNPIFKLTDYRTNF